MTRRAGSYALARRNRVGHRDLEDGKQETYPCNTVRDDAGVLKLSTVYKGSSIGFSDQVSNERAFPLANIRLYVVNRVS